MAAITVTAIELGDDAEVVFGQAGETIGLGDAVYLDTGGGNKWKKCVIATGSGATALKAGRDGVGIALTAVTVADRYMVVVTSGTIYINTLGGSADGETYIAGGSAAGDINPVADAATTWYKTTLGTGGADTTSYDEFILEPNASGKIVP